MPTFATRPLTLYEKIWQGHLVKRLCDGTFLIWIDRHLLHEVSSPQAFNSLREAGRGVRRPDLTLAVPDHNVPTTQRNQPIQDAESAAQIAALEQNCLDFGIEYISITAPQQGIVHVIGPEQGYTLPGLTLVCGDSHTATHGALGALAFCIGTSEVEHVLATQTLRLRPSPTLQVNIDGALGFSISAKDVALAISAELAGGDANGCVIEYSGAVVKALSIEGRMTICNMAIEIGARAGLVAPDEATFAYLKGRCRAPQGAMWEAAMADWRDLQTDPGAAFDRRIHLNGANIAPLVSWGTSAGDVAPITGNIPDPGNLTDPRKRESLRQALAYMGLDAGESLEGIPIQHVFIGSCANGRIEDLRQAAAVVKGRKVAANVRQALVVPGSGPVKRQAESEGLDRIFIEAGFQWREPGCSMCLAMNADKVPAGERCASTSNRNSRGRQGPGARTHLLSPAMAAAAAVIGKLTDVRQLLPAESL